MRDTIIEEIHRVREAYARRFDYDLTAMFRNLQDKQAKRANLVDLSKKAVEKQLCVAEETTSYSG